MPVTVNNNYEIEVTPESWQRELHDALPYKLRHRLYTQNPNSNNKEDFSLLDASELLTDEQIGLENRESDEYENLAAENLYNMSKRLYNIHKLAGNPNINYDNEWRGKISFKKGLSDGTRAYYVPGKGLYNIKSIHDLPAEYAHIFLSIFGKNKDSIINRLKSLFRDDANYKDVSHLEWETHGGKTEDGEYFPGFEGELKNYIFKGTIPTLFPMARKGGKLIPKRKYL